MTERVEEHFRLFNDAVRSQDRTAFLAAFPAAFTPDAVMTFNGAAVTVTFDE